MACPCNIKSQKPHLHKLGGDTRHHHWRYLSAISKWNEIMSSYLVTFNFSWWLLMPPPSLTRHPDISLVRVKVLIDLLFKPIIKMEIKTYLSTLMHHLLLQRHKIKFFLLDRDLTWHFINFIFFSWHG